MRNDRIDILMPLLALLLVAGLPAQTAEDAHVQHEHRLADTALNVRYRRTMGVMALADRTRGDDPKKRIGRADDRPTDEARLLAAQRAWLTYRDAHCVTVELRQLSDSLRIEPGHG